jgi:hypothetical protein
MHKAIVVLAVAIGAAAFAPAASACIDDAPCPRGIPSYQQYIPKGVPSIPKVPRGELPDPPPIPKGIPKPPKASQQNAPKKVEGADASGATPKASESDVKGSDRPSSAGPTERGPVCTRYMPTLGRAVEIPCE